MAGQGGQCGGRRGGAGRCVPEGTCWKEKLFEKRAGSLAVGGFLDIFGVNLAL